MSTVTIVSATLVEHSSRPMALDFRNNIKLTQPFYFICSKVSVILFFIHHLQMCTKKNTFTSGKESHWIPSFGLLFKTEVYSSYSKQSYFYRDNKVCNNWECTRFLNFYMTGLGLQFTIFPWYRKCQHHISIKNRFLNTITSFCVHNTTNWKQMSDSPRGNVLF